MRLAAGLTTKTTTTFFLLLFIIALTKVCGVRVERGVAAAPSTTPTPPNATTEDEDEDWDEDDSSSEFDDDGRIYKNPRNSPSTLCPRDEEQATMLGQKCLRKCSSDEDCKSKKKKCLCDGACGMSCIKPDRECAEPEQIQFGSVTASGRLFGARATYTCQHGYHVVGLQSRTCQADGNWAGQPPACKQNIYCLSPPTIDHAKHNALPEQTTFDLDSTLQYYCHTGYVTNGFPRAKCLAIDGQASWYGPDIACEPRSCGAPVDIAHGWHAGECYTYGCKINYHCAEGFELVGKVERFCQADGTWSPKELPTCVLVTAVQCPAPENPRHGKAIYTSCSYNSVVSYECKYGYNLVGEGTRRCGADRKWTGTQPVCKEINCGHPGRLWNGWLENIEGGTGLGASIIFRCHEGMTLEGNSSTVCQVDGKWRYPLPRCLAPCVVPHVSQGVVILVSRNDTAPSSTVVSHGEQLSVECNPQYEFPSPTTAVSCNNGTWTHMPKCVPARCKHLPKAPKNGMVIAPKMEHGMKAKFKCKDGTALKGNMMVECSFGNWTGETPKCEEVFCPYPGLVEHGKILLVGNMGLYDYRPYVKKVQNNKQIMYDCEKGYILNEGPTGATCVGGGWSPRQLPKCVLGQHPRLRWSRRRRSIIMEQYKRSFIRHHKLIYAQREKRSFPFINENQFQFLQEEPHSLFVRNQVTSFPIWIKKYFNRKEHLLRNKRDLKERFKRALKSTGGSRTMSGLGHKSGGSLSLRRNKNSRYDDEEDNYIIEPPEPPDPTDDTDAETTTRKHNGKKKKPKRKKKGPCEALLREPYISFEIIKFGKDPNVSHSAGTIVKVGCASGYSANLSPNKTAKCVRGRWKPVKPTCLTKFNMGANGSLKCFQGASSAECVAAPCQLPEISNGQYLNGYRAGLTIANASSVTFQCDDGFVKSTVIPIQCILGELYPKIPSCRPRQGNQLVLTNTTSSGEYLGGSDIIRGGEIAVPPFGGERKPCGPPAKVQGSLIYRNGEPLIDNDRNFPDGTEVTFNCIESIMGEKTTWRILCEDGSWIGRSLNCEDTLLSMSSNNSTCIFRNQEPNVISFYNDQQIREEVVEFPAGALLTSRCIDIGKYAMNGPNQRTCMGGEWDGPKPVCFGLNQENDYSMEKPPTILFRYDLEPVAQSNNGKLIVYPGAILHMECLWIRRFGNPKWQISHDYRLYPQSWTTDPNRDSGLEYRLSIFHASKEDSGVYTCITPARHSHSIEIIVKAVHCPEVPTRRGLKVSSQSTKMNTELKFSCNNGNALIGSSEIRCLPSGNWSAPFPVCESIECGEVGGVLPPHLRVSVVSREVGGKAVFSCAPGFGVQGPLETVCLSNGEWATPYPSCVEVTCDPPGSPENGYIQGSGPFKAGDVVQFNCNQDFMMEGQPIIACQDNGRWSGPLPTCVQACSYPGTTISGRMSSVKFYYKIGENITFTCDEGHSLRGAAMLKCLRNGKWSNAIPTCILGESEE